VACEEIASAARGRATGKARARAGFVFWKAADAGFLLAVAAAALFSLAGCISLPQTEALRAAPPAELPARVELAQVPFFEQGDFLCGPATLAMVFNAAGKQASVESLTPQVYLPGRQGSLQAEMLGATRRAGLVAYPLAPQLEALMRETAAGRPAVVLLNLSFRFAPIWHYAVVIGYDRGQEKFIMRSGRKPRDEWSYAFLEFLWKDSGYWAMLALPPGELPASAREAEFAAAVAALEQAGGRREARASYRALLERWPQNLVGLFGLGNVEYALGDLAAAESAFRRATLAHPQSAPAFNNLAHVLAQLGRLGEAETAARRAVELGGPTLAEANKTLEAILARRATSR
jgi:tetratricopeptide (TPR) repeat protein